MSEPNAPGGPIEASLLARVVAAIQSSGRRVTTDWEAANFEVLPVLEGTEATVGIIRESSSSVIFYQVWPEPITDEYLPAMVEFVIRANVDLSTSCFELNPDSGILAVRCGLGLAGLSVDGLAVDGLTVDGLTVDGLSSGGVDDGWSDQIDRLLINALDETERVAQRYGSAVSAVISGTTQVLDALEMVER